MNIKDTLNLIADVEDSGYYSIFYQKRMQNIKFDLK